MEEKREKKAYNKELKSNEYTNFDPDAMRSRARDTEYASEIASTPEEKEKRVERANNEDNEDNEDDLDYF